MNKLLIALGLALTLSSCGSTTNSQYQTPQTNAERIFNAYPKDTEALEALVNEQLQQFDRSSDPALFRQLLVNIEQLAEQKPQDREVIYRYYRIGLLAGFVDGQYDVEKWQQYYQKHKFLKFINIAPPVYMQYLLDEETLDKEPQRLLPILHQTVKASPAFVKGHVKLANHYLDNNQIDLAVFLLANLAKLYPEDPAVLEGLNWARLDLLQNRMCSANVDKSLQQTFEQSKTLTKLVPENPDYHILLGSVLREKGSFMLSSFSVKRAAKLDPINNTVYLESEFWNTKLSGIEQQLANRPYVELDEHQNALVIYAQLVTGKWSELFDAAQAYAGQTDISLYGMLYGAYSTKFLGQATNFEPLLTRALQQQEPTLWLSHMYDYALGRIDETSLLAKSQNRCNESEARFLIGLEHGAKGDIQRLYQEMQNVIDLDVKSYYEFASAKNILKYKAL